MATALRVQTVRYGRDAPSLLRMLRSVTAAARRLGDGAAGRLGDGAAAPALTVAIGDCGGPEGPDALVGEKLLTEAREILARAGISLEYVVFGTNTGHGAGQNLLAKRAAGSPGTGGERDVLVLLNPDTYVSPSCLATLVGVLDDDTVNAFAFSPDGKYLYVGNFLDSDVSILEVDGTKVTDTGKRLQLPGHPASMRGPTR